DYDVVIGLEVHIQLLTDTKIFCGCSTRFGDTPNTNVCPVCLGMPGVLPVLNEKVVDFGIKLGLATNSTISEKNIFARKNYFYPDLPKGYQITQYDYPLCQKGFLDIDVDGRTKRIGITRIHMEEDAGKLIHDERQDLSYVDFNRSGVPLLEIVSEPDMSSTSEAVAYLKELRQLVMYLGICDGNMEQGSFRCDANISVKPKGALDYGIRTELKNMNSFRNVQNALEYEISRHVNLLEEGKQVEQETRLWDANAGLTRTMRTKEESHDYRYFPEPDLIPLVVDVAWVESIRKTLPELPRDKRYRFVKDYGIPMYDAEVLTQQRDIADYFEACLKFIDTPKDVSNWIMTEVLRVLKEESIDIAEFNITPKMLSDMITLIKKGVISGKIAKGVFEDMHRTGKDPSLIVDEKGLLQIMDEGVLKDKAKAILNAHPKEVKFYKDGKKQLLGFFVGQLMKETRGRANPKLANKVIKGLLEG
ncbi:MAG TPA: Asp-tRNA(Asn)/Glu-tRNA(Gln) amidotransferase subunit GatB, partial [Deltaproteobacteria bacterium]|nr:Asp-tRNA(Asn)/Glu-tRNA(Gln) amidotransferase subunit GatB [Deltaproteobacteria bacterium]